MYLAHIVTSNMATIATDEGTLCVPASHVGYNDVVYLLNTGQYEEAIEKADACAAINEFGEGKIVIKEGVITYNGEVLDNGLTKRVLRLMREGFTVTPMINFLENLQLNPSLRAREELYRFLESNDLPITPDGYFLAYKNVGEDYYDKYSRTFRNMVGDTCKMDRSHVMDDPSVSCSRGLHFCSINYLKDFWGTSGHTMVIKIHPRDVVSIPYDYDNAKGRCCEYTVVAEHTTGTEDTLSARGVWYGPQQFGYGPWQEGYEAFFDDASPLDNPYYFGVEPGDADEWENGYYFASTMS